MSVRGCASVCDCVKRPRVVVCQVSVCSCASAWHHVWVVCPCVVVRCVRVLYPCGVVHAHVAVCVKRPCVVVHPCVIVSVFCPCAVVRLCVLACRVRVWLCVSNLCVWLCPHVVVSVTCPCAIVCPCVLCVVSRCARV